MATIANHTVVAGLDSGQYALYTGFRSVQLSPSIGTFDGGNSVTDCPLDSTWYPNTSTYCSGLYYLSAVGGFSHTYLRISADPTPANSSWYDIRVDGKTYLRVDGSSSVPFNSVRDWRWPESYATRPFQTDGGSYPIVVTSDGTESPIVGSFIASPSPTVGQQTVGLYATGLSDSDGTIKAVSITQISGTVVTLSTLSVTGLNTNNASAVTTFTSPDEDGTLVFRVSVTDNDNAVTTQDLSMNTTKKSVVAPPTGDGFGLEVYGPNEELYLSITDDIIIFIDRIAGTLAADASSDDIPLTGNPTSILWLNAPSSLSLSSLSFSLVGNTLTVSRSNPSSTGSIDYEILVLGE